MVQNREEEKCARDILEEMDPEKLTDGQHIALALYTLVDVIVAGFVDDEEYDEDEED